MSPPRPTTALPLIPFDLFRSVFTLIGTRVLLGFPPSLPPSATPPLSSPLFFGRCRVVQCSVPGRANYWLKSQDPQFQTSAAPGTTNGGAAVRLWPFILQPAPHWTFWRKGIVFPTTTPIPIAYAFINFIPNYCFFAILGIFSELVTSGVHRAYLGVCY